MWPVESLERKDLRSLPASFSQAAPYLGFHWEWHFPGDCPSGERQGALGTPPPPRCLLNMPLAAASVPAPCPPAPGDRGRSTDAFTGIPHGKRVPPNHRPEDLASRPNHIPGDYKSEQGILATLPQFPTDKVATVISALIIHGRTESCGDTKKQPNRPF